MTEIDNMINKHMDLLVQSMKTYYSRQVTDNRVMKTPNYRDIPNYDKIHADAMIVANHHFNQWCIEQVSKHVEITKPYTYYSNDPFNGLKVGMCLETIDKKYVKYKYFVFFGDGCTSEFNIGISLADIKAYHNSILVIAPDDIEIADYIDLSPNPTDIELVGEGL